MLKDLWAVAQNVLTLFILIGVGAVCRRTRLLNEEAVKCCASVVLYIATPCVILGSCMRAFDRALLTGFLTAVAGALVLHLLLIGAATLIFRDRDERRRRVLRFATVFSNAGYMAIPLQQALLGEEGVFYCAAYLVVFNTAMWTYGARLMSGDPKALSAKRLAANPGIIAVVLGLLLFLLPIEVPDVLRDAVGHLGTLNTPLPMLIVGYYLAGTDLRAALRDRGCYLSMAVRLLLAPAAGLGLLLLCGVRGSVLTSMTICMSTPTATATTMFAARHDGDTALSVELVSLTTLCSVLTMPVFIALAAQLGAI